MSSQPAAIPKNAVLIGGAMGIGEATVRRLCEDGWTVFVLDINGECAAACAAKLAAAGYKAFSSSADITSSKSLSAAIVEVRAKFGVSRLGAAVNTVGVFDERRPLIETDEAAYRRMLELNLNGAFLFSKAVEPLLAPHASILHVSSVNGFRAGNELGAYKIAKAGLHMLVRCLAADFARDPRRIRANCVSPGWVDTPGERRIMAALGKPDILDDPESASIIPLRRRTEPREIADAIAFLVSSNASAITGQILSVDCGIMIQ